MMAASFSRKSLSVLRTANKYGFPTPKETRCESRLLREIEKRMQLFSTVRGYFSQKRPDREAFASCGQARKTPTFHQVETPEYGEIIVESQLDKPDQPSPFKGLRSDFPCVSRK